MGRDGVFNILYQKPYNHRAKCGGGRGCSREIQGGDRIEQAWAHMGTQGSRKEPGGTWLSHRQDQLGSPQDLPSPMTVSTISQAGSSSWAKSKAPCAGSS